MQRTYNNYVLSLDLQAGMSKRVKCPACGVRSLSVTREMGMVKYHCFRASCKCKGILGVSASATELRERVLAGARQEEGPKPFDIPEHWVMPNERTRAFLASYNIMPALTENKMQMRYDPKEDRNVFLIMHEGVCYGAIGRAVAKHAVLKAKNYHKKHEYPFVCGDDKEALVVEDCTSAAAASHFAAGIALAGTDLHTPYLRTLATYDHVIIALDKDAASKSLELSSRLKQFTSCSVALLPKDFKDMTMKERHEWYEYNRRWT